MVTQDMGKLVGDLESQALSDTRRWRDLPPHNFPIHLERRRAKSFTNRTNGKIPTGHLADLAPLSAVLAPGVRELLQFRFKRQRGFCACSIGTIGRDTSSVLFWKRATNGAVAEYAQLQLQRPLKGLQYEGRVVSPKHLFGDVLAWINRLPRWTFICCVGLLV